MTEDFLTQISAKCPHIYDLRLDNPTGGVTAEGFLKFLECTPSIAKFCSASGLEKIFSEKTWLNFASRPSFNAFAFISHTITRSLSSTLRDATSQPFMSMTSLECSAESTAIIDLLPHLFGLQFMALCLVDASIDVLSNIASNCPHLRYLIVDYGSESQCDGNELISVAERCKALEHFRVSGGAWVNQAVDGFSGYSDTDIERFTKGLPKLKICHLEVDSAVTEASLYSFGRNCRTLEELLIRGSIDLKAPVTDLEPLFPKLKELEILELVFNVHQSVDHVADILRSTAPLLERCTLNHD